MPKKSRPASFAKTNVGQVAHICGLKKTAMVAQVCGVQRSIPGAFWGPEHGAGQTALRVEYPAADREAAPPSPEISKAKSVRAPRTGSETAFGTTPRATGEDCGVEIAPR